MSLILKSTFPQNHIDCIWCVKYHPTKQLFASCGSDALISIWEYNNEKSDYIKKSSLEKVHTSTIRSLDWDYSGEYLSAASFGNDISVYKIINSNDNIKSSEVIEKGKISDTEDLLLLFESKEKIAREMIERRFPAPQMTNTKFNSVLDNCKEVVESQINILNALTPTDKTKYEIASRKKLIKELISKVDDLTNELILSEENNIEEVIDDMDGLINSIKDYK